MKLYVVTEDGYDEKYGCQIYLKGVYDSYAKAQRAEDKQTTITEVDLNVTYPLKSNRYGDRMNDLFIGGYME